MKDIIRRRFTLGLLALAVGLAALPAIGLANREGEAPPWCWDSQLPEYNPEDPSCFSPTGVPLPPPSNDPTVGIRANSGVGYSGERPSVNPVNRVAILSKARQVTAARFDFAQMMRRGLDPDPEALADLADDLAGLVPFAPHDDWSIRVVSYHLESTARTFRMAGADAEASQVLQRVDQIYGRLLTIFPNNPILLEIRRISQDRDEALRNILQD